MSLVIENKRAVIAGELGKAKFADGTKPRALAPKEEPKPQPNPLEAVAAMLAGATSELAAAANALKESAARPVEIPRVTPAVEMKPRSKTPEKWKFRVVHDQDGGRDYSILAEKIL